ncbi:hypothetical protein ACX0G9_24985 [Flavitalea flava]
MQSFKYILFLLAALFLLGHQPAFAQEEDSVVANSLAGGKGKDSSLEQEKGHFIIGVTYHSAMNYYGRVDSFKSKGLYPFAGFSFRNGLFLNATFVFIHNDLQTQYAATLVEGGYNFKNKKGNWAGSLSASKYFYQANTDLIQSAVKEVVTANITNLNKIMNITVGADAKLSDKTDFGLQVGLDHIIRIPGVLCGKDVIVLDPSAYIYSGTQHFSQTYYQQKNLLLFPVGMDSFTKNSQEFNVLAYEFSMPIVYGYKKINLILTPAYILPQHMLTAAGQSGVSERGTNLFYITTTLKFTL